MTNQRELPAETAGRQADLRILHVSPTHYSPRSVIGGGERYIEYMIAALHGQTVAGRAASNTILTVGVGEVSPSDRSANGTALWYVPGEPWQAHSIDADDLRSQLSESDVVVVHQCLSGFGLFAASHARRLGKVVVGLDHGGGDHALARHSGETGRIFDLFIAYSRFGADSFHDLIGRVEIISGPVDTNQYTPGPAENRDPLRAVVLGRALPHKGFDDVIDALPQGMTLSVLSGSPDPTYWDYLKGRAKKSKGTVEFAAGLSDEDVKLTLQESGLFVHASTHVDRNGGVYPKSELLGLAPLEAMSCGTPALVRSTGALAELGQLVGCRVFDSTAELEELLQRHAQGRLEWPAPEVISDNVRAIYGLSAYGQHLADVLTSLVAA